jgi:hypothetical protein
MTGPGMTGPTGNTGPGMTGPTGPSGLPTFKYDYGNNATYLSTATTITFNTSFGGNIPAVTITPIGITNVVVSIFSITSTEFILVAFDITGSPVILNFSFSWIAVATI